MLTSNMQSNYLPLTQLLTQREAASELQWQALAQNKSMTRLPAYQVLLQQGTPLDRAALQSCVLAFSALAWYQRLYLSFFLPMRLLQIAHVCHLVKTAFDKEQGTDLKARQAFHYELTMMLAGLPLLSLLGIRCRFYAIRASVQLQTGDHPVIETFAKLTYYCRLSLRSVKQRVSAPFAPSRTTSPAVRKIYKHPSTHLTPAAQPEAELCIPVSGPMQRACQDLGLPAEQPIPWSVVKKKYNQRVRALHPDKNKNKAPNRPLFDKTVNAYKVLLELRGNLDSDAHYQQEISQLAKDIDNYNSKVDAFFANVDELSGSLDELSGSLDELSGSLDELSGSLDELTEKNDVLTESVAQLHEDSTQLRKDAVEVNSHMKSISAELVDMNKRADRIEAQLLAKHQPGALQTQPHGAFFNAARVSAAAALPSTIQKSCGSQ